MSSAGGPEQYPLKLQAGRHRSKKDDDRTIHDGCPETTQVLPARLEPDAIGAAQDTIIGMANSAPTVAIGLSLASLAAAAAYGSGPVIILCGIPMLIIANAYRRLNLWSANCGASFEWVGRAINPYLGFLTGWLMIAASLIRPSPAWWCSPRRSWPSSAAAAEHLANIVISTAVIVVLLVIAVVGIRLTARTQVAMGVIEYVILIGFSVWGSWWRSAITMAPSRSPVAGSASAGSAGRAAWPRACSSRCSCSPAGTPRSTSTRR